MAMVYLSNRNISEIPKDPEPCKFLNNELKNELEELNMLLEKKEKENKIPFNTLAKGHDVSYKYNPIPGPGAYNLDIPKKIIENENSPFLYKSQRFKKINKELIIPGPGSYNINNNKISLRRNKSQLRPNSNISLHNEINSKNNVATIPTKKQEFGYNIDKNGQLSLAVDPIADYCFSGAKNDSIGPGRYDPVIKEKNHCIRWDKSTGRKSDIFFGANTETKNEKTTNSSLIDTDISSLKSAKERNDIKKVKQKPFKFIRYKNIRNNSEIANNKEEDENIDLQKEFDFLNHKNNIISGPKKSRNYLLKYNKMRYPSKPAEFQFFGSSNRRNLDEVLILNNNTKVGPGSYFHNTFKKFQNLYINKNKYSFENTKEGEKKLKLRRSLSNVGPGSYNIDRFLEKKSFNIFGSFSTEKRFGLSYDPLTKIENDEGGNPGPGSYNINNDSWVKDVHKMIKKPILVNVDEEIKKPNNTKIIENQPDFNLYQNNRYINIIQENIRRKANPYTSENNPFLSGNNRFKIIDTDFYENIGPGKYDLFKKGQKTKRFYSILAPFNTLEEKKPIYIGNVNNNVAPGQHSKDSYFDWNKKSFNVLFN